jgi:type IV secretion system protein TrbL
MNDLGVIDQFTDVFSRFIDGGFGLLGGEVRFLSTTLVAIDMTLAGIWWAMGGRDVLPQLLRKILYVGAFVFIINNFNALSGIVFRSFAGLGLVASGSPLAQADLFRPGQVAAAGVTAAQPLLTQIGSLTGFPDLFLNLDTIVVLFLAWLVVIVSFFILAVQMFVTLIEFKLTTLAGFVIVPFSLWNKSAFLAERVLGNVVSTGLKALVLALIIGIGTGLFGQFASPAGNTLNIENALALMLASLALLGLGIFGPSIATGLVAGAPQLGAGAAAGTALVAGGLGVAAGAAVAGSARLVAAGAGLASRDSVGRGRDGGGAGGQGSGPGSPSGGAPSTPSSSAEEPGWAKRAREGGMTAAHVTRTTDRGGSGPSPSLTDGQDEGD